MVVWKDLQCKQPRPPPAICRCLSTEVDRYKEYIIVSSSSLPGNRRDRHRPVIRHRQKTKEQEGASNTRTLGGEGQF